MAHYRSIRDFDWPMMTVALALCGFGVLQIFSATHDTKFRDAWWKQVIFIALGLFLFWLTSKVDYHTLMGQVFPLYIASMVLLVAVFVVGDRVFGSKRWIPLLGATFQVSEFFKVVLVLLIARLLSELRGEPPETSDLLRLAGLVGLPMALVLKQPDLGTALTYLPVLGAGIFLAGLRGTHIIVVVALAILVVPASWFVLKDYQKARLTTFLDPTRDPRGTGYQVIQSRIAVGSGALWGQGVTKGTQTQLRFLPVPHTDFIFSAFAEEHGFVGVVAALSLYFLLLMMIVQNAQMAPDRAGMYITLGVGALLLFHVLVNVGMAIGRMPVVGIPLPLMSAGGSNTLTTFILLGLVNNVRLRRFAV
jgi:rod shape determining protein RodA